MTRIDHPLATLGEVQAEIGPGSGVESQSNLTHSQFLLWMGQKLYPDIPLYNMIQTFTFHAAIDAARFQQAFQRLVASHDTLRMVIAEIGGVPQQRVQPDIQYHLDVVDLSQEPDVERAYADWLDNRRIRLLDLGARLFDSALIKLGEKRWVWYLCKHHLITDGWSFVVIYRNLAALYEGIPSANEPPAYRDYVDFERAHRQSDAYADAQKHWRGKLASPVEPLVLYDKAPRKRTARTERVVYDLGPERTAQLKAIAAEKGIQTLNQDLSLFNIFATIFCAYLHRISGNQQLMFGTPFHNRTTNAFKETVGLFIEICPLRVEVAEDDTFLALLKKIMRETFSTLRYAQPGISSAEHNRSYEVLLNFVNVTFPAFAGMPVQVDWVHSGYGDSNHLLHLQVQDFSGSGSYKLQFDFNCNSFSAQQREWAVEHFLRMIDEFIADRTQPINRISLLSDTQAQHYLAAFNQTAADYPIDETIISLFEKQVERTPNAAAVVCEGQQWTYAELNARSNQVAHYLRGLGVGADIPVAILMEHSLEVLAAILGVLKAGGAYVPVDPTYPAERIDFMLDDIAGSAPGGRPIVLTQPDLAARISRSSVQVVPLDAVVSMPDHNPDRTAASSQLAYIIYTSGSTGKPKGVMIEHRSLVNYIWWAKQQYLKGNVWDFPLFSSLSFDLTVTSIYTPLIIGGRIIVYREDEGMLGMAIMKVIQDNAVDIVKLTPAHLVLIRALDLRATRIKALIVGGEDFKTDLARGISSAFDDHIDIYNEYGPTEATVGCMIHRFAPDKDNDLSVPIGVPAANSQIYVLDKHLNPVPGGVIGEMHIGGDGLARGYLNRPELNAQKFIANPFQAGTRLYRTGDMARWNDAGRLEFLGRVDHQVKVGGVRIELGEIEAQLLKSPDIRECVVAVVQVRRMLHENGREESGPQPGEHDEKRLAAYYVSESPLSSAQLRAFLAQELPNFMIPTYFMPLERLPLTRNGKVDRAALPHPQEGRSDLVTAYAPPETPTETKVIEAWIKALGISQVGIHDNFFELGGSSLPAIQIVHNINQTFQIDFPLPKFFEQPTIAGMSRVIEDLLLAEIENMSDEEALQMLDRLQ